MIRFLIFLFFITNSEPTFITEYHLLKGKKMENRYIKKYENSNSTSVQGYVLSLKMKKAKYTWNPMIKLQYFKEGRKKLDSMILKYPTNYHLRYIRLVIQEKTPSILGYKKYMKEDKKVINQWLSTMDSLDYLDKYILKNTSL
jgi:hypothetical protein